ncbi:CRISPR-associated endonuclease Cas3'' [Veronia nyctiphanis]|uniref:CRISPR-associated endonuclease Cas3 n=1 Tax=Veronia nyctiphanis TaxID=1278244 RepID=A0A4Q0YD35_9GAMM|nr:CRISPR-associated endonuclease Cas3'' [Veronia nyctiphanis]RXJ68342.1 CRISPR-associated endonuclease Cas3'' [Veronia nyctiphanis]
MTLLANSKNQSLIEHSRQVSENAAGLFDAVFSDFKPSGREALKTSIRISALLHDIGKVSEDFQAYLKGEEAYQPEIGEGQLYSADNPLHHELSLVLFDAIWKQLVESYLPENIKKNKANRELKKQVQYGIYWHHAEPVRKKTLSEIAEQYFDDEGRLERFADLAKCFLSELLGQEILLNCDNILDAVEAVKAPRFFDVAEPTRSDLSDWIKDFQKKLDNNVSRFIVRFLTIFADRHVSGLSVSDIYTPINVTSYDDSRFLKSIKQYIDLPKLAGKRTDDQLAAAVNLVHYDSNVIMGAAGCGKTRTALMAYHKARTEAESSHKGMLWVCPRIAVGLSVLEEIKESLPDAKVSILTGETQELWQGEQCLEEDIFEADIVITTIDQVAKWLTSNSENQNFLEYINRYTVFDEYHELFSIQSLYYISAVLMRIKEFQTQGHVFISATPEPMHLRLICRHDASWQYPVVLPSFNEQPVHLSFVDKLPEDETSAAYVFNTASKAQDQAITSWRNGRDDIMCYHSKFTANDKAGLTHEVLSRFGRNPTSDSETLFAGPIAQASLNISRKKLNTELSHPANVIQRIGRSNRFAEYGSATVKIQSGTEQVHEKKGKYGTFGSLKNTGARKNNFKGDRVVPDPKKQYYAGYSYKFYQALVATLGNQGANPEKLAGNNFTTSLNDLNDFYRKFHIEQVEKNGKLVDETKEFVIDALQYLDTVRLYKPTKLTIETNLGKEVAVSYRGGSIWATMCHAEILPARTLADSLIGMPGQRERLVSITESDCYEIDVVGNLNSLSAPEFKRLKSSLTYRAKYAGREKSTHLAYLAKQPGYPLVCSTPSLTDATGLYYLHVFNEQQKQLAVGFKRLKKGLSSF